MKAAGRACCKRRLERRQRVQVEAAQQRGLKHLLKIDRHGVGRVLVCLEEGPTAHGFATDSSTLPQIATVTARQTGVRDHPAHVWRLLQGPHWSLQRPTRQARERDEAAIRAWRRRR